MSTRTFSTAGVIVAVAFVALPFVVITMESGFRSVDRRLGLAAATLGAGPASVARTAPAERSTWPRPVRPYR